MTSPGSCARYKHLTLGSLLEEVIEDIAHNILHVTESIRCSISDIDIKNNIKLTVMGPTNHLVWIRQALEARGIQYQLNQPNMTIRNEMARGGSDLIGIVGMSGRFPGSETVERFWEDLMSGKCHIKEVSHGMRRQRTAFNFKRL